MKNRINLKSFIKVILDQLRSLFFNGLLMLLPVTITFYLFKFLFHIMQSWLSPLRDLEPEYLQAIPYLEFALAVTLILILGLISRNIIFKQIINHLEKVIGKIPLIKPIYRGSKQLVHAFTHHDKDSFQQIVYIEFPRKGVYSIGFVTSELKKSLSPNKSKKYYNVFIPTSPNPTTGYYVLATEEDLIPTSLTRQEAMTLVISGGIVQPDRFE